MKRLEHSVCWPPYLRQALVVIENRLELLIVNDFESAARRMPGQYAVGGRICGAFYSFALSIVTIPGIRSISQT